MAITDELGRMVGPLPLGAWLAVVGGGLGFALYSRKNSAADSGEDEYVVSQGDGETSGVFTGGAGGSTSNDDDGALTSVYEDQDSWGAAAIRVLIAFGTDPVVAQSAISAYLNGQALTVQQHALVSTAMTRVGPPPQLPLSDTPATNLPGTTPKPDTGSGSGSTKPPTGTTTPTKNYKYYTVRSGDNLTKIAKKYKTTWQALYNANKAGKKRADGKQGMISNANKIKVGWKLLIP